MADAPNGQISLTDPDARAMATSARGSGHVGYNVQSAVDTGTHLIVAHEVTNQGFDRDQLALMAKAAKAALGRKNLHVVADILPDAARCTYAQFATRGQKRARIKGGFAKGLWQKFLQRLWCVVRGCQKRPFLAPSAQPRALGSRVCGCIKVRIRSIDTKIYQVARRSERGVSAVLLHPPAPKPGTIPLIPDWERAICV